MPSMTEHESFRLFKGLVVAESGCGKTGALASLVDAGYNLRVLDFDNGMGPVRSHVKDKAKLANVHYRPLRDQLEMVGRRFVIKKATAFSDAMDTLMRGGDLWGKDSGIPSIYDWTERDILVIDTLGMLGRSALLMVMDTNNASTKNPEIQHFGIAMEQLEKFVGQMTSEAVGCHIIMNTHIAENKAGREGPEVLGDKLISRFPRYFDNMISLKKTGSKREFRTDSNGDLVLKTAVPLKSSYPLETGWADIFKDYLGKTSLP